MNTQIADAPAVSAGDSPNAAPLFVALLLGVLLLVLPMFGYGPFRVCPTSPAQARATVAPLAAPEPEAATPPIAPSTTASTINEEPTEPATTVAPATPAAVAETPPLSPTPSAAPPPAARVYFETARSTLPGEVVDQLAAVVAYLKANPGARAAISGFHDPRGSASRNARLAERRARGVAAYLADQGIGADRVDLLKPSSALGDGPPAEARRVEVTIKL